MSIGIFRECNCLELHHLDINSKISNTVKELIYSFQRNFDLWQKL